LKVERSDAVKVALYGLAAALLCWVALINGFPLLFADSGAYLRVGTELYFPYDRPVTYGLTILPLYRVAGLWGVIGAQALFAIWLIARVIRAVTGTSSPVMLIAVVGALALLSSLPWFVGQIMPDLFAGLAPLLAFLLIFARSRLAAWEKRLLPLLLALLVAFHLSLVPIIGGLAVTAAVVLWLSTPGFKAQAGIAAVLGGIALAVLALCSANLLVAGRFKPSLMSDTFMFSRLLDGHVAQRVLADTCPHTPLILCRIRPMVDNPAADEPGQDYMWKDHPELAGADEARIRAEEIRITHIALTERTGDVARMAISGFARQLVAARAGDGMVPYGPEMQVSRQIDRRFPSSAPAWRASMQQGGRLRDLALIPDRALGLIAALIDILIIWPAYRRGHRLLAQLAFTTTATLLLNAAACSLLSGVFERFQSRVLWLAILTLAIAVACWCVSRRSGARTAA
jgi:hypothetical protein